MTRPDAVTPTPPRRPGIVPARPARAVALLAATLAGATLGLGPSATGSAQEPDGLAVAAALESRVAGAIAAAEKGVVAILAFRKDRADVFVGDRDPRRRVPDRFGAGVVFDDAGHIVTCAHVLGTVADHDYEVWQAGRAVPITAVVSAASGWMDLAVLTVEPTGLTPLTPPETPDLRKGQFVIALGNPYAVARDGEVSASWGIVSNLTRPTPAGPPSGTETPETVHGLGTLIQTDAGTDLGASGGALIDLRGRWIGLMTRLPGLGGDGGSVAYAIPVDADFLAVAEGLATGRPPRFGFLGVMPDDTIRFVPREGPPGATLRFVQPGTPADAADLREGDVVTRVDGRPIAGKTALLREIGKKPAGSVVSLTVIRGPDAFGRRETFRRPVTLTGRSMATAGDYASVPEPSWRGLEVETWTVAASRDPFRQGFAGVTSGVTVTKVAADSPGWRAGLRPGTLITTVEGTEITSPEQFYRVAGGLAGPVTVVQVERDGRQQSRTVEPEPAETPDADAS